MNEKKSNIFEKLSKITTELWVVEKWLEVKVTSNNSYKAVSERDVLDAVKPLEEKYGVYSYPYSREIVENETITKSTEYQGTKKESTSLYMRIKVIYRFVNIENPQEYIETVVYGDGIDTGDKAPWKAMTYADKYALMKVYKISTWDDPDKEASPENVKVKIKSDFSEEDLEKITISTLEKNKSVEEFIDKCRTVKNISKEMEEKIKHKFSEVANSLFEDAK